MGPFFMSYTPWLIILVPPVEQDIVMSSTDADAVISRTLAELCPDGASSVSFEA